MIRVTPARVNMATSVATSSGLGVLISIPADKAYGTQEEVDADGSGSPAGDLLFVVDILGATESAEQPEAPATGDATDGAEDSATADDQASAEG